MTIKGFTREEQAALKRLVKAELAANPPPITEKEIKVLKQKKLELQREHFKKFDEQLGEVPLGFLKKRQEIIEATGWKDGDGLCPLHFADKQTGSQCTWSVIWLASEKTKTLKREFPNHKELKPRDYYPTDSMTSTELLVEATDLCNQKINYGGKRPDPAVVDRDILSFVRLHEAGEIFSLVGLRDKLIRIRENYVRFICPWDPAPGPFYFPPYTRVGWGETEILQELA